MQDPMPHFKYRFLDLSRRHVPCIEAGGKVIHEIEHLREFYGMFGYTREVSASGLLPDEFIWSEYTGRTGGDFTPCIQIHIIEYLLKHSDAFRAEYGARCEKLLADHAASRAERGVACAACRAKSLEQR